MRLKISYFFHTVLLCLLLTLLPSVAGAQTFPPTSTPTLSGIDVSAWQGEIDWNAVRKSGVEIAMLRASEGETVVDSTFERNYSGAKASGVAVGFYHFMTADTVAGAQRQADFFAQVIDGKDADCLLALDVGDAVSLSDEELTAVSLAFLSRVEARTGLRAMLYADAWAARARFGAALAQYPIWVANYGVSLPEANGKWASWVGFQYSDQGEVDGIRGHVDLDQFTREIYQSAGPVPTPTPTPSPAGSTLAYQVKSQESVSALAKRLGTTEAALRDQNEFPDDEAQVGQIVRYPGSTQAGGGAYALHILQARESLSTLARRYGVSVQALALLNGFSSAAIPVGQVVRLPEGAERGVPSALLESAIVVQTGQTLQSLSAQYGVSLTTLAQVNGLRVDSPIYRGQLLHLRPSGEGTSQRFRGGYVINRGDTLTRIAARFAVTLDALLERNDLYRDQLIYPGQIVLIP